MTAHSPMSARALHTLSPVRVLITLAITFWFGAGLGWLQALRMRHASTAWPSVLLMTPVNVASPALACYAARLRQRHRGSPPRSPPPCHSAPSLTPSLACAIVHGGPILRRPSAPLPEHGRPLLQERLHRLGVLG